MSKTVQFKRGNANVSSTYTGADGEITINTTNYSINVHDGVTEGGYIVGSTGNLLISGQEIVGRTANTNITLTPNGTGQIVANSSLIIQGNIIVNSSNLSGITIIVTSPTALANLSAVEGGRAFVNDSNITATGNFGIQVGSGGSNVAPVWSDGTNWYIG